MRIKYLNNLAEIIVSIDEGKNITDANIVSFTDRGLRLIGQMKHLGLDIGTLQETLAGMQMMCGNRAALTELIDNDTDGGATTTIAIGSPLVTISGSILTINPSADLLQGKAYHVEIDSGALIDGAGNVYTGISNSADWNFGISDPSISVDLIATDNIVNAVENTGVITVSGTVFSSVPAVLTDLLASDITVVLTPQGGGSPINVTVTSYNNATGAWSGTIPANTFDPAFTAVANKLYDVAVSFLGTSGNAAGYNAATASLVVVDTVAPTQTITIDSISLDSGEADFITNDNNGLTVSATLSAPLNTGEILQYSNDNGVTWSDVSTSVAGTAVTVVDATLTSTETVKFRVADAAANTGDEASRLIIIDTTAPTTTAAVTAVTDNIGITQGTVADGGVTDDTGLDLNGTLTAGLAGGETVRIYDGTTYLGNAIVSGTSWTFTDSRTLSNGQTVSYTARVADTAGNRLQRITDQDTLSMIFSGQWAGNNLNSSEKYSLGGVYGVRAYPQGEGSGDMGAMLKLELAHHFTPQLRGTVFYDYGHIRVNQDDFSEADNTRTLSGAGLGLNAALEGWQLDSYVAWPLQGGEPLSEPESSVHTPRLWMQMSGDF